MADSPIPMKPRKPMGEPPDLGGTSDEPETVQREDEVKEVVAIPKPPAFSLDGFKSGGLSDIAGVETLQTGLPHYPISHAKDFVRLHPDEAKYWSDELCFVKVPIKGMKGDTLHLILKSVAKRNLDAGKVLFFRLVLASKPGDVFFLCHVPSRNPDNEWNKTNLEACEKAKTAWVEVVSRAVEGVEGYKTNYTRDRDAFEDPKWPQQPLDDLIGKALWAVSLTGTTTRPWLVYSAQSRRCHEQELPHHQCLRLRVRGH